MKIETHRVSSFLIRLLQHARRLDRKHASCVARPGARDESDVIERAHKVGLLREGWTKDALAKRIHGNATKAHRLAASSALRGAAAAEKCVDALQTAHFAEGRAPSDPALLDAAAVAGGTSKFVVRRFLQTRELEKEVAQMADAVDRKVARDKLPALFVDGALAVAGPHFDKDAVLAALRACPEPTGARAFPPAKAGMLEAEEARAARRACAAWCNTLAAALSSDVPSSSTSWRRAVAPVAPVRMHAQGALGEGQVDFARRRRLRHAVEADVARAANDGAAVSRGAGRMSTCLRARHAFAARFAAFFAAPTSSGPRSRLSLPASMSSSTSHSADSTASKSDDASALSRSASKTFAPLAGPAATRNRRVAAYVSGSPRKARESSQRPNAFSSVTRCNWPSPEPSISAASPFCRCCSLTS